RRSCRSIRSAVRRLSAAAEESRRRSTVLKISVRHLLLYKELVYIRVMRLLFRQSHIFLPYFIDISEKDKRRKRRWRKENICLTELFFVCGFCCAVFCFCASCLRKIDCSHRREQRKSIPLWNRMYRRKNGCNIQKICLAGWKREKE